MKKYTTWGWLIHCFFSRRHYVSVNEETGVHRCKHGWYQGYPWV